jgi:uncharacterized protein YndB with AHSA1/START domain
MDKLRFTVDITAPVDHVWDSMLDPDTYREWTHSFHEGSHYTGGWNTGDEIRFLGPDDDGRMGGMIARVVENRPAEFVSLEYTGQIIDGVDDFTSAEAKELIGAHEDYSFSEHDGVTTVDIAVDSDEKFSEMFQEAWPVALAKLGEIAERDTTGGGSR